MDTREILEQLQKEQITLDQGRSPAAQAALRGTGLCEVGYAPESTVGLCGSHLFAREGRRSSAFHFFTLV